MSAERDKIVDEVTPERTLGEQIFQPLSGIRVTLASVGFMMVRLGDLPTVLAGAIILIYAGLGPLIYKTFTKHRS